MAKYYTIICDHCKKEFVLESKAFRKTRRFCSMECTLKSTDKMNSFFEWEKASEEEKRAKLFQNFYRSIIIREGCWNSIKVPDTTGYIRVQVGKKKIGSLHRLSWELHNGPIPEGMMVRHLCGNPRCCRPSHLAIGSQKDNYEDSRRMGTNCQGSRHGNSKINEQQAKEIKQLLAEKRLTCREIAKRYGVSRDLIKDISRRKTWKHVP